MWYWGNNRILLWWRALQLAKHSLTCHLIDAYHKKPGEAGKTDVIFIFTIRQLRLERGDQFAQGHVLVKERGKTERPPRFSFNSLPITTLLRVET